MIKTTKMPIDGAGNAIPVLGLKPSTEGGTQNLAIGSSSETSDTFSEDTLVITIFATSDCFIELGNEEVEATTGSHFLSSGKYFDLAINDRANFKFTHLAVLQASAGGTLYISERV